MLVLEPVSDLEPFKSCKLATKFKHKPTNKVFLLRRITDSKNRGTLYLWNKDDEEQHFDIYKDEWEQVIPPTICPQEGLRRLLECIHDGDRVEILQAMDELHDHIRYMGDLPIIQKDIIVPALQIYIVPDKVDDISCKSNSDSGL